ncbi:hypothetical protein F0562_010359 [Nyssa sinensis]|uniref:Retrovirus-related Pol polyprotein from transposon TNT 1-94-like beta-barrel domain-containing protein n=1 Tax=Nyssa sinensis TaxID=561372 RepID=A0A5J5A1K4_9ASTE|nr:hypothetical protein F0562_010359 [Nyssa sinensis]
MLIALFVKNKLGFVDGSIPEPQGTDTDLFNSWIRNNNIVISWILNSVSKEISASIIFAASAREIWLDLRDRFQQRNGPRIFQLKRELMNLRQEQSSVSIYFTKLKTIWEELSNSRPNCSCGKCSCGGVKNLNDHHQMEYIMSFLMGLDDSFSQVRGQLLLMDPMPPINRVFSLIVQEEQQRKTNPSSDSSNSTGTMAFAVKIDVTKSDGSGPQNSQNSNSSASKNQKRDKPYCTHCKIRGHTVDRCYKIHGYPPGYKFRSNNNFNAAAHQVSTSDDRLDQSNSFGGFVQNLNSNQYQQLMSMLSTHLSSSTKVTNALDPSQTNCLAGICFSVSLSPLFSSNQFWIVDSGATRHICSQASAFVSLHSIHHTIVTLPNHSQILVHFAGDVKLHSDLVLKDVLFVPQFKFNLISVSALVTGSGLTIWSTTFSLQANFISDLTSSHVHDPPVTSGVLADLPIDRPDSNSPIVSSSGPSPSSVASTSATLIPVNDIPALAPYTSGVPIRDYQSERNSNEYSTMDNEALNVQNLLKVQGNQSIDEIDLALNQCGVSLTEDLVLNVLRRHRSDWKSAYIFFNWVCRRRNGSGYIPGTGAYNEVLDILGRMKRFEELTQVLDEMSKRKGVINERTYGIVLNRYAAAHKVEEATQLFYRRKEFDLELDLIAFQTLLMSLCRYKHVEAAEFLFHSKQNESRHDIKTRNIILNGWCVLGSLREAKRFWNDIIASKCKPDQFTYGIFINSLTKAGKLSTAVKLFRAMWEKGCNPDVAICNCIIDGLCFKKRIPEALEIFREMNERDCCPDVATYNSLIKHLCNIRRMEKVNELLDEMEQKKGSCLPNARTYGYLLKCTRKPEEVPEILERMERNGCKMTGDAYNLILRLFMDWDYHERVRSTWVEMEREGLGPDQRSYTIMIHGLYDKGRIEDALCYYNEMTSKGMVPEPRTKLLVNAMNIKLKERKSEPGEMGAVNSENPLKLSHNRGKKHKQAG